MWRMHGPYLQQLLPLPKLRPMLSVEQYSAVTCILRSHGNIKILAPAQVYPPGRHVEKKNRKHGTAGVLHAPVLTPALVSS